LCRKDTFAALSSGKVIAVNISDNLVQARATHFVSERNGDLPVWVRAPKRGREFYSGCSRPKLYEWRGKGFIHSVSIREPGRIKGVRLFHLASILGFINDARPMRYGRNKSADTLKCFASVKHD